MSNQNYNQSTYNINYPEETTLDLDNLLTNLPTYTLPNIASLGSGTVTINTNNGAYSAGMGTYSVTNPYTFTTNNTTPPQFRVNGDAEFDGEVKIKGRSLEKMLEKIEDRLAILQEPDPKKLEKFAALKKAYDQYKLLEKLIGEEE